MRRFLILALLGGAIALPSAVPVRASDPLSILVSRAAAPLDAGGDDLHRSAVGDSRAAHEPIVAGPLLAARLREECLRRACDRRRWTRAGDDAAGSVRVERAGTRRNGDRALQSVR